MFVQADGGLCCSADVHMAMPFRRHVTVAAQVWHNTEEGELVVEATQGLRVVLDRRSQIQQALCDAKYHRIIHVRNAATNALREVRKGGPAWL